MRVDVVHQAALPLRLSNLLSTTQFTENLIRENALDINGFAEWIFDPGMLFNAQHKWWADRENRPKPHEGLDVCFYSNSHGSIQRLDENTKIPALFDGTVVKIIDDFLGKSVFIQHILPDGNNGRLFTLYGHTTVSEDLGVGKQVKQGEFITTLAAATRAKAAIPTHLHISLGWTTAPVLYDQIDWGIIGDRNILTLIDPVEVIDGRYTVVEHVGCQ